MVEGGGELLAGLGQELRLPLNLALSLYQPKALLLGTFALGDDVGEHHQAADHAVGSAPWLHLPAQPFNGAIGALERILVATLDGTRQHAPVGLTPGLRDVWEHVVVTPPDDLLAIQLVIAEPATAGH